MKNNSKETLGILAIGDDKIDSKEEVVKLIVEKKRITAGNSYTLHYRKIKYISSVAVLRLYFNLSKKSTFFYILAILAER